MLDFEGFVKSALALFIIMDPFASLPIFITLTKKYSDQKKLQAALSATVISAIVLLAFVLAGPGLMRALAITMPAFTIAGGLLLLLTAIISFLGIEFQKPSKNIDIKIVVIAVPLLTGPGAMTTSVILAAEYGLIPLLCAIAVVVALIFAILSLSRQISKLAGENGIEIFSKVFSILLAAIAIEFIKSGTFQIISEWGLIP